LCIYELFLAKRRAGDGSRRRAGRRRLRATRLQPGEDKAEAPPLEDLAEEITPERAHVEFDQATLQLFWMRWPQVSAWTGSLWRLLSEELAGPATPFADAELDEVGESG
jgi:hypothetical protein